MKEIIFAARDSIFPFFFKSLMLVLFKMSLNCMWVHTISVSEKQLNKWNNSHSKCPCWVSGLLCREGLLLPEHCHTAIQTASLSCTRRSSVVPLEAGFSLLPFNTRN